MLAMQHNLTDDGRLMVYCMFSCKELHTATVRIATEDRLKLSHQQPRFYYRMAENVLLSAGKARYGRTKLEEKAGVEAKESEKRILVCAECSGE